MTPTPSLEDLAAQFQACTLPRALWTHEMHLRIGAWHVHRFGATDALLRLRDGIRRLNTAHGTANTPAGGYHETITAAYVTLIAGFLSAANPAQPLDRVIDGLLAGPLGDRALLLRFWSREALMSSAARAAWLAPDRAPLALPAGAAGSPADPEIRGDP